MPTKGDISKSYVSTFALDFPEIREQVIDIYNEQRFTNVFVRSGAKEVSKQHFYKTVYNEALFKQGDTTGSTVTGSGSATIGTTTTVATSGFARKNDLIEFITSGKIGVVYNVVPSAGADTLTIKSVDGTNITHVAGEKLIIFSNANGEKSTSLDNIRYGLSSKVNKLQIIKETSMITDVENASVKFVKWNGENRWYVKDHLEKKLRLERMLDANFIKSEMSAASFEDTSSTLVDQVGGGNNQTNRGLNKYLENDGGILLSVNALGTFAQVDLDALCDAWIASRVDTEITAFGADAALRKFNVYAKALGSSGITSAKLEVNGTQFNWTVQKLTHGKFTISFSGLPILDDPDLMGGTLPSKCIYYLPMGMKVQTQDGSKIPILRTRYMKSQSPYGSDMVGEIHTGAFNKVNPNGAGQYMQTEFTTEQGLELLGPQLCTRQRVLS